MQLKKKIKKKIRRFFREIGWKVEHNIGEAVWYVKHHTTHRYHYLKLSQPKDKDGTNDEYHYGWIDSDRQMLYALFNILCNFVEKELDGHIDDVKIENEFDRPFLEQHNKYLAEIRVLYHYWKVERAEEFRRFRQLSDEGVSMFELENDFDKHEEEMMIRLVKVRGFMWT